MKLPPKNVRNKGVRHDGNLPTGHVADGIFCAHSVIFDTEIRKFEQINGSIQNAFGIVPGRRFKYPAKGVTCSGLLSSHTRADPNQLPIDQMQNIYPSYGTKKIN